MRACVSSANMRSRSWSLSAATSEAPSARAAATCAATSRAAACHCAWFAAIESLTSCRQAGRGAGWGCQRVWLPARRGRGTMKPNRFAYAT